MKVRLSSLGVTHLGGPDTCFTFITAPKTVQCSERPHTRGTLVLGCTDILLILTTNLLIINQFESFQTTKQ